MASAPGVVRTHAASRPGAVLLETTKFDEENFQSFLFLDPVEHLVALKPEDVDSTLARIDAHIASGSYVAGFVAYECGYVLHGLQAQYTSTQPLIQMGVFDTRLVFNHISGEIEGALPAHPSSNEGVGEAAIGEAVLDIAEDAYAEKLQCVRRYLQTGHSYQVNFTDGVSGEFLGSPMALYRTLIGRQPVPYGAYVNGDSYQVLSLSPELFYRCGEGRIVVKPMKGTWPRGVDLEDDVRAAQALQNDEKNRAEHITIVDLLRNDLGRVCTLGSVQMDRMLEVTRYSTLHQMTSTISGIPSPAMTPTGVFRTLFPSGSITGAPKLRTMGIIRELEGGPRGVYTGAIGYFAPGGKACFSVAIRTLVTEGNRFRLGVGGGITLDSDPAEEYRECQLKASFLTKPKPDFHLFETMLAEGGTIPLLERHLKRLRESSAYFGFHYDEQHVRQFIAQAVEGNQSLSARVRLTVDRIGRTAARCSALEPAAWVGKILLSDSSNDAADVFLHHKTSQRQRYDNALADAQARGYDEVLFLNKEGFVAEGAISNVFLHAGGRLITPTVSCGLLPGVQRAHLLDTFADAQAVNITLADLRSAQRIWFCNALRGSREVTSVWDQRQNLLWTAARSDVPAP